MHSSEFQAWVDERRQKDEALYERYGRPLEPEHNGEFVAISDDGRILLENDQHALSYLAVEQFGAGNFALRKIGAPAEIRILRSSRG